MKLETSSFDLPEQPFAFDEIQELVHHGATSLSYKVRIHNKWHFLKRPKLEFANNPLYVAAFEKEFDLGFRLDHPNIVRYVSKGIDENGLYIITEFVDGVTLTEFIKFNPDFAANRKNVKRLLLQLCEALRYLHSHNIIHYDLKPDNILITRSGYNIKLIDLGFSYSDCYEALACGTKNFSAPEQFSAPEKCDIRSDIYSFGRIIEFIFYGKPPHKYKRIYCKATHEDINSRQSSVEEITRVLSTSGRKRIIFSLLGIIVLFSGILYLFKSSESTVQINTESPATTTSTIQQDIADSVSIEENINIPLPTQLSPSIAPTSQHRTIDATIVQISIEEKMFLSFQEELSRHHSKHFSVYYDSLPSITSQKEYVTASELCTTAFNGSRAVEDSLMAIYIPKYPNLERQLRKIAEEEMWTSMSKHLSMLREYMNSTNDAHK